MNVHVIIGTDEFLVSEAARKVIGDGVGLEVIDSASSANAEAQLTDIRRVDESFSTPPFFDPSKITWWKNVNFLPGANGKKPLAEEVKSALEAFAQKLVAVPLPENQKFILTAPALLKTSLVAKALQTGSEMVVFPAFKPWEAEKAASARVTEFAANRGLSFDASALASFIAIVGTDTRSLVSELDKLRDYLGPKRKKVTREDVEAIASPGFGIEPQIWAVTDAIGERDAKKTLSAIHPFELENGFEVMMTTVIERFFRQLVDIAAAKAAGKGLPEGMNPYAARKNEAFLRKWRLGELRRARARFVKLRARVVSGCTCGDVLVITELLKTLAGKV